MWKVKRMNRARIVVLTVAIGIGGVTACLASALDSKAAPPAGPAAPQSLSPALRSNADAGQVEIASDDQSSQRSNINAVRSGVTDSTAVQK
jgi:pilus assembly protein CpaB